IMSALRSINERLLPGASAVMNISPALHEPNSPARSTIPARLVVEVEKELGWSLMDWLPWHNPSAPPGPTLYASRQRVHLCAQTEFNLWWCTDPKK
ncbi:site-specific DNA-methyltransferase, partial [Salmonella enterica subsp. enterica serovar 1,4,[5],12:i:-]